MLCAKMSDRGPDPAGSRSRDRGGRFPRLAGVLGTCLLAWGLLTGSAAAVDLSGHWSGTWKSCSTGHQGPLSACFTPCGDGAYRAEFTGRFFKVFPFRYSVVLRVVEDAGDSVTLAGSSFLGRLFGTFTYRATADGCRFDASYASKKDVGLFRMTRD